MAIPRFLKILMPIFICVALIRAVNNAGPLSVYAILLDIKNFEFDLDSITDMFKIFSGSFYSKYVWWDYTLFGVPGLFTNLGNVLSSFFNMLVDVITVVVKGSWNFVKEVISLLGQIFELVFDIFGFDFTMPSLDSGVSGSGSTQLPDDAVIGDFPGRPGNLL